MWRSPWTVPCLFVAIEIEPWPVGKRKTLQPVVALSRSTKVDMPEISDEEGKDEEPVANKSTFFERQPVAEKYDCFSLS